MDAQQSIVMVDCCVNLFEHRLEVGWVALREGDHSPTVILKGGKLEVEIELPATRRHFPRDVMQSHPQEPIFFKLTRKYIKDFGTVKTL